MGNVAKVKKNKYSSDTWVYDKNCGGSLSGKNCLTFILDCRMISPSKDGSLLWGTSDGRLNIRILTNSVSNPIIPGNG